MKQEQLMICPNTSCPERETCQELKPHKHSKWCDVSGYYGQKTDVLCPKCIDITCKDCNGKGYVEPDTCPEKERRINLTLVIKGDTITIE